MHVALIAAVLAVTLLLPRAMQQPAALPADANTHSEAIALLDGRLPDGATWAPTIETSGMQGMLLTTSAQTEPTPAEQQPPASMVAQPTTRPTTTPAVEAAATPPAAPPAVVAAVSAPPTPPATPEPAVRAAAVGRYAPQAEVEAALAATAWPRELWPTVLAIAYCESGIDSDRDGHYDAVDTLASGAGGLYIGVMQIDVNHRFSSPYDLRSLHDNLTAAHELWIRAGHSFAPWGCH